MNLNKLWKMDWKLKMVEKVLLLLFLLSATALAVDFVVGVSFTVGKANDVTIEKMYLALGEPTRYTQGPYSLQLVDENGAVVEEIKFDAERVIYTEPGGAVEINEAARLLYIPFNESAKKLRIAYQNSTILYEELDLQGALCTPNGVCEEHENMLSCSPDCFAKDEDNFCSGLADGVCDLDCGGARDLDCPSDEKSLDELKEEKKETPPSSEKPLDEQGIGRQEWQLPPTKYLLAGLVGVILLAIVSVAILVLAYLGYKTLKKPPKNEEFD
ncbi:MAG: hypothetical protein ABIH99_04050 [Candidatus Micrarchaeota archaeon]